MGTLVVRLVLYLVTEVRFLKEGQRRCLGGGSEWCPLTTRLKILISIQTGQDPEVYFPSCENK